MLVSVVVRTFNEERYLPRLLAAIEEQSDFFEIDGERRALQHETLLVDSGSTDRTLEIAAAHDVRILHIEREHFSFGRSLNIGCEAAEGEILVFISGHCVPCGSSWLSELVAPIAAGAVAMTYGRQLGGEATKFSEHQVFAKLYPEHSDVPQEGFFSNNANSAVSRKAWLRHRFDEDLLGLEDMHLAKALVDEGESIGYVAEAAVYHYHHESWAQVRRRYEREAIALQRIRPEWHLTFFDFARFFAASVMHDSARALMERRFLGAFREIVLFRLMQYWGSYRGNHEHRRLAEREKLRYFYPV